MFVLRMRLCMYSAMIHIWVHQDVCLSNSFVCTCSRLILENPHILDIHMTTMCSWLNNRTLGEFCFTVMGRADIEGWKSQKSWSTLYSSLIHCKCPLPTSFISLYSFLCRSIVKVMLLINTSYDGCSFHKVWDGKETPKPCDMTMKWHGWRGLHLVLIN
jgi:hypothetical protein